jgi:hypothetical protein
MIIGDIYMTVRDALQAAGIAEADYSSLGEFDYTYVDEDGSVYVIEEPGWLNFFGSPKKKYIASPKKGKEETISQEEVEAHREEAEAKWGKFIPGNLFNEPRFIPGTERKTIPAFDFGPSGRLIDSGYVDEDGVHWDSEKKYNDPWGGYYGPRI